MTGSAYFSILWRHAALLMAAGSVGLAPRLSLAQPQLASNGPASPAAAPAASVPKKLAAPPNWSLAGGYTFHDLADPGVHLGAELVVARAAGFTSVASALAYAYYQPDIETGFALHARWGQRYTASFGLTFESHIGLGVQYTSYTTTVYEFEGSVGTPRHESEGLFAFTPNLAFGPGFDFERLWGVPLHVYARPGITVLFPDLNDAFQASVMAELGLRWTLGL